MNNHRLDKIATEKSIAQARADEREKCCRDVCIHCRGCKEWTEARSGNDGFWFHAYKPREASTTACLASPIRERIHQEGNKSLEGHHS